VSHDSVTNKISILFETKRWCSSTILWHKLRAWFRQQFNNDNSTGGSEMLSQALVSQIPGMKTADVGCNEDWQDSVDVELVVVVRSTVALESETKPSKLPSKTPSALAEWWWAGWFIDDCPSGHLPVLGKTFAPQDVCPSVVCPSGRLPVSSRLPVT